MKDHLERRDSGVIAGEEFAFADGAVDLPPVGVAADADVQGAESRLRGIVHFLGKQDGSGAGPGTLVWIGRTALASSNPASPRSFRNVPDSPPG